MMGAFHVELMCISAINTFCKESGLQKRMINACVFAGQNTADRALEGKHYKRAFRALSLEHENMHTRAIQQYMQWLKDNNDELYESEQHVLNTLADECGKEPESARDFIHSSLWTTFCVRQRAWLAERGEEHGQLKLELTYMKMFELLFDFYVAVRDSRVHGVAGMRSCLHDMTSLAEWANRSQYTRVLPVVTAMFDSVEEKYPTIAKAIKDGTMLSANKTGNRMGCIALDYALETGTNFMGKKVVIKIAARTNALNATMTTLPEIIKYTAAVNTLTGGGLKRTKKVKKKKKDSEIPPRSKKDEGDFSRLRAMVKIVKPANPYKGMDAQDSHDDSEDADDENSDGGGHDGGSASSATFALDLPSKIWNSTNGNVASTEASESMLGFPENTAASAALMLEKLDDVSPTVSVWSKRTNFPYRNFNTDEKKKLQRKKRRKTGKHKDGGNAAEVFRQFIAINEARAPADRVALDAISKVELTYPSSLLTFEGLLNKGSGKAKYVPTLFGTKPATFPFASGPEDISDSTMVVVDLMMHVRQVRSEAATKHVSGIMPEACKRIIEAAARAGAGHVVICADNYKKESTLKDAEHYVRGEGEGAQPLEDIELDAGVGKTPGEFNSILASRTNKRALVALCHKAMIAIVTDDSYADATGGLVSFTTMVEGKAETSKVTLRKGRASVRGGRSGGAWSTMDTQDVPELHTKLDEADHMIVIATAYAKETLKMKRVIVNAGDADVIVSILQIEVPVPVAASGVGAGFELGIMTRTGAAKERIVDVSWVQTRVKGQFPEGMQDLVLPALINLHLFNGSDFTSQFDGVTKQAGHAILVHVCDKKPDLGKAILKAIAKLGTPAFADERKTLIDQAASAQIELGAGDGEVPTVAVLEHFCCILHGSSDEVLKVNALRLLKFASLSARLSKAPPTQNAFLRHVQRVDLAAQRYYIAFNSPAGAEPDPEGRGWEKREGMWWPIGISCEAAPKALIAPNMPCGCNKKGEQERACFTNRCKCMKGTGGKSRKCTAACGCKGCENGKEPVTMPEPVIMPEAEDNESVAGDGQVAQSAEVQFEQTEGEAESETDGEDDECAVQALLEGKRAGKGFRFKVKWASGGDGSEYENSWMSTTNLRGSAGMSEARLKRLIVRCARRVGVDPSTFGVLDVDSGSEQDNSSHSDDSGQDGSGDDGE